MTMNRIVFFSAALFNWVVGAALILAMPLVERLLGLTPVTSSDKFFVDVASVLIIAFGCAYWLLGMDFQRYRLFAPLGAYAKLAVVAIAVWHYLAGNIGWQLPALTGGDLIYSLLFFAMLREARLKPIQGKV